MHGKILKILGNDLYGNADERRVAVFAAFNHTKYMNKYVIFSFVDEYNKKKLYYGSAHLKKDSIVIFAINDDQKKFVDEFVTNYLANTLNEKEYQILDIQNVDKVELVSYKDEDCDKLLELDNMSIKKEVTSDEATGTKKTPIGLYILLVIMIALLAGVTYIYFFPDTLIVELKLLECEKEVYNDKLSLNYLNSKTIKFEKNNKVRETHVIDTYTFKNLDDYFEFKNNNRQAEYFNITGAYKYDDDKLQLKLMYDEETIIDNYDELYGYLKKEGYTCQEGKYYE